MRQKIVIHITYSSCYVPRKSRRQDWRGFWSTRTPANSLHPLSRMTVFPSYSGWILGPETKGFPARRYRRGISAALVMPMRGVAAMPRAR